MTCDDVKQRLEAGDPLDTAEATAHLEGCPDCRLLVQDGTGGGALSLEQLDRGEAPESFDELFDAVSSDIAAETGVGAWFHSRPTPLRIFLGVAMVALVAGISFVLMGRVDIAIFPRMRLTGELVVTFVVIFALIWIGLRSAHRPALPSGLVWGMVAVGVVVGFILSALPMAHDAHPESLAGAGDDLAVRALYCLLYGLAAAIPAALLMIAVDRGDRDPVTRTRLAAATAGLAGLLALQVHCPITQRVHLLVGHAPVVLVSLLIGAGLARLYYRGQRAEG